jgi:hypothetical protein
MPRPTPDAELTPFEAAFASLTPAAGPIDRDRLMFRAGQAAARPGWLWPAAAAALALVAAGLGAALAVRRPAPAVERVVYVPREEVAPTPPASVAEPPAPAEGEDRLTQATSYWRLRQQLFRAGPDARPPAPAPMPTPSPGRWSGVPEDAYPRSSAPLRNLYRWGDDS